MHELLVFHSTAHGSSVQLSDGNSQAARCPDSVSNAIVFSSRPLVVNQKVRLELTTSDDWPVAGHLRLGLTDTDPGRLSQADLPKFAFPDLADRDHFWVATVDKYISDRTPRCITLCLTPGGSLMFGADREASINLLRNLPLNRNVWLLVDIYGRTTAIRIVQPDDVPEEILALGPASVKSYEASCADGYKAVYRTRLVLFGQDVVGKNCLRSRLLNFKNGGKLGLSASAIDLSASFSFSLSNSSKWKQATSSEEIFPNGPVTTTTDCEDNIEAKNVAMATNVVLQILHRRRYKGCEEATRKSNDTQSSADVIDSYHERNSVEDLIEISEGSRWLLRSTSDSDGRETPDYLKALPAEVASLAQDILTGISRLGEERTSQIFSRLPYQRLNSSLTQSERDVLFNVIDCSGDEAHFVTNQVFLSSRGIFMFVFDLRINLDEIYPADDHPEAENGCNNSSMSCLEYFDYWLRSIRVHASAALTKANRTGVVELPPIFIIGTNREDLHSDRKEQQRLAEKKFEQIKEMIRGRPYEGQIIEQFYAISKDPDIDTDIEQIDMLRCHVETVARSLLYMGELIPNRWISFEQAIDRLVAAGTNFCSMGQLNELALEEGITATDEFETLVQFYHELGLIMHFGLLGSNCLNNSVILKPLWLVDTCKSILAAENVHHLLKKPADEAAWHQYTLKGILTEHLLELLLGKSLDQRAVVISCMEKLDLIVERSLPNKDTNSNDKKPDRSFMVPFRFGSRYLSDRNLYHPRNQDVIFYYDFGGFLPDVLFYKILVHVYRWSQSLCGSEPRISRGRGRFYFDGEHDFVLILAPKQFARFKVVILRVLDLNDIESDGSIDEGKIDAPPKPYVAAKVRNFLELTLCELRETWMKRLSYAAYVQCWCDRPCTAHRVIRCTEEDCLHFLSLDECLSNKVVYCDHRRCKTSVFRKVFPTSTKLIVNQRRIISDRNTNAQSNGIANPKSVELPVWVKSAAKLLNSGSEGFDWMALAKKLGYKRNKIESFNYDPNPGLALVTDWIISSGNTALSVDMMVQFLEQMHRNDVVEVIQKGQEVEENPPQVFISYQWEIQDEVAVLRDVLERNGLTCWMDIGQMGGGDHLYGKIYEGIKNAKVAIACLTHKYLVSHYCNRELALADLLHKPIIPVLFEMIAWPPVGPMSLIFSTLIYVNLKGVGGHGGSGIHADLDAKYQEIVTRVSNYATPHRKPFVSFSTRSSSEEHSLDEPHAPGSDTGQQMPSNFYTPYSLHNELQSSRLPGSHSVRSYRASGTDVMTRVQPVHVAKCVMCTVL